MKKKSFFAHYLIGGFALLTLNVHSQAPNWQWAKTSSEISQSQGNSVCIDVSGNSYVTGYFQGPSISFGSFTLTANGSPNLFLVKYDPFGNVLWATNAGGSSSNQAVSVACDDSGNVFITGNFGDSIVFGSTTLLNNTAPYTPMFLAKYNSSGNVIWARRMGGNGFDHANSVATDPYGNSYVTGLFAFPNNATFGSIALTNTGMGGYDVFIVKYDPFGNALWAKGYGADDNVVGRSVTTDASGNNYVSGSYNSPALTFGSTTLTGNGYSTFLVKSDASGNVLWAKGSSGTAGSSAYSVSCDPFGNTYMTGNFWPTSGGAAIIFGTITLTNLDTNICSSCSDVFLVKYDSLGNVLWARSGGGPNSDDYSASVFADSSGSYITGYFAGQSISFGSSTLVNNGPIGARDLFLVKYDPLGNVIWAKSAVGIDYEIANSVTVDALGNNYVTGLFDDTSVAFGSSTLTSNGSTEKMFIAKTGNGVGINSFQTTANGISIFPNPSSGIFILEVSQFENGKMGSLEIYDVLGEKIVEGKIISKKTEFDLSENAKGIYFYRIFSATEIMASGKIIVK